MTDEPRNYLPKGFSKPEKRTLSGKDESGRFYGDFWTSVYQTLDD